jgi:hypothetical protein
MSDPGSPERKRRKTPGRLPFCRASFALVATVGFLQVGSTAVAAHGTGSGGWYLIGLPWVLSLVVGAGLVAGVFAATGGSSLGVSVEPATVGRAVGAVLLVLGGVTALSALTRRPAVGLAGVATGAVGGGVVVRYGGCGVCADATVGAIVLHRLVEGLTLAAAYAAGSAVGAVGAAILAGHTVAECAAVGGNPAFERRRAVGAVLAIEAVFICGVVLGTVSAVVVPAPSRLAVLGLVGGLLAVLGADEVRSARHAVGGARSVAR